MRPWSQVHSRTYTRRRLHVFDYAHTHIHREGVPIVSTANSCNGRYLPRNLLVGWVVVVLLTGGSVSWCWWLVVACVTVSCSVVLSPPMWEGRKDERSCRRSGRNVGIAVRVWSTWETCALRVSSLRRTRATRGWTWCVRMSTAYRIGVDCDA